MRVEGGLRTKGVEKNQSKDTPLISIITVVYNNDRTLERAIESVSRQNYENVEYLVIDGGSTDGTLDIIKKHEKHIDYYRSEPDGGIYDAMNKGIGLCRGQLIGLLNSDDWYEDNALSTVADAYREDDDSIQYGICRHHDRLGPIMLGSPLAERLPERMIAHATVFVPATFYRDLGRFDTRYRIAADYDLMLRFFMKKKRFRLHCEVLANFEIGGACHQNLAVSRDEINTIKYRHGIISIKEKQRLDVKNRLRRGVEILQQSVGKLKREN